MAPASGTCMDNASRITRGIARAARVLGTGSTGASAAPRSASIGGTVAADRAGAQAETTVTMNPSTVATTSSRALGHLGTPKNSPTAQPVDEPNAKPATIPTPPTSADSANAAARTCVVRAPNNRSSAISRRRAAATAANELAMTKVAATSTTAISANRTLRSGPRSWSSASPPLCLTIEATNACDANVPATMNATDTAIARAPSANRPALSRTERAARVSVSMHE